MEEATTRSNIINMLPFDSTTLAFLERWIEGEIEKRVAPLHAQIESLMKDINELKEQKLSGDVNTLPLETSPPNLAPRESNSGPVPPAPKLIEDAIKALSTKDYEQRELKLEKFTLEGNGRYGIPGVYKKAFKIFPWYTGRTRQTLNPSEMDQIVKYTNFLLRKCGYYSQQELSFFRDYFNRPAKTQLSNILSLWSEYIERFGSTPQIDLPFEDYQCSFEEDQFLEYVQANRADVDISDPEEGWLFTETDLEDDENHIRKKRNLGGDRATYYPIRRSDFPSRDEWCKPGAVVAIYSDGVGKLRHLEAKDKRNAIGVCSTAPDTVEEHPDRKHDEEHCLIVMIGEAPVILREDMYNKLPGWSKESEVVICDIYVSNKGDVCIRKADKKPPAGGVVFARTAWRTSYPTDEEGYPTFQGVRRAVCAKIFQDPSKPVKKHPVSILLRDLKYHLRSLSFSSHFQGELSELQEQRKQMIRRRAVLKSQPNSNELPEFKKLKEDLKHIDFIIRKKHQAEKKSP